MSPPGPAAENAARDPSIICSLVSILSILLVGAGWVFTIRWSHWWRENGIFLPTITEIWLTPTWHMVAATVMIGGALLVRVRGLFAVGLGAWIVACLLYLVFTVFVIYIPTLGVDGPLGSPPHKQPSHWYWPGDLAPNG